MVRLEPRLRALDAYALSLPNPEKAEPHVDPDDEKMCKRGQIAFSTLEKVSNGYWRNDTCVRNLEKAIFRIGDTVIHDDEAPIWYITAFILRENAIWAECHNNGVRKQVITAEFALDTLTRYVPREEQHLASRAEAQRKDELTRFALHHEMCNEVMRYLPGGCEYTRYMDVRLSTTAPLRIRQSRRVALEQLVIESDITKHHILAPQEQKRDKCAVCGVRKMMYGHLHGLGDAGSMCYVRLMILMYYLRAIQSAGTFPHLFASYFCELDAALQSQKFFPTS